jgi:hypothetical protein
MDNIQKINIYKSPPSESFRCIFKRKGCFATRHAVAKVERIIAPTPY